MVTEQSVHEQLKRIGFKVEGWGRTEVRELPHILLPDEEIFECVNGIYEGGFALLVGTDVRVLLVDKKPFNFLTVEDLRFDLISELDYNHQLMGAHINISAGDKHLKFHSYNQQRLRKLITHVQHCMAAYKKQQNSHQEGQNQHLEQINQQLQAYLIAQHQHQEELYTHLKGQNAAANAAPAATPAPLPVEPIKPNPELADYLFAQSLLAQYREQNGQQLSAGAQPVSALNQLTAPPTPPPQQQANSIYADGMKEVFGKQQLQQPVANLNLAAPQAVPSPSPLPLPEPAEVNPLRVAYAKLPTLLRHRKFSRNRRPSFAPPRSSEIELI